MTQSPDEYGDVLRRALRAEADAVVPSPDGLEIIRARIERRNARNLFWWRAGAAAASAVLVAGTIVMTVPQLRSQIIEQVPALEVENETTSEVPSNSSTTRSQQPPPSPADPGPRGVVAPEETVSPSPRPTKTAGSTSRPSRPADATPSPCPTAAAEDDADPAAGAPAEEKDGCAAVAPTPSPSDVESPTAPPDCPFEECPPGESPEPSTAVVTPLLEPSPAS